jgi:hypothetical protein
MDRYLSKLTSRAKVPDKIEPATATPEAHVVLHKLCRKCRTTVRACKPPKDLMMNLGWTPPKDKHGAAHGSVAQLIESSESCHLCSLLLEEYRSNRSWHKDQPDTELDMSIINEDISPHILVSTKGQGEVQHYRVELHYCKPAITLPRIGSLAKSIQSPQLTISQLCLQPACLANLSTMQRKCKNGLRRAYIPIRIVQGSNSGQHIRINDQ